MTDVASESPHRNPLHRVAIVGAFNTPQAKRLDGHTSASVTMMAIQGALDDAGLSYRDVDGLSVTPTDPSRIQKDESLDWAYRARLGNVWAGSAMLAIPALLEAALAIASGQCSTVVIASGQAGLYTDRTATAPWTRPANEFVQCWGLYTAAEYALVARRHMHQFGTTSEQLALAAATVRTYGAANPAAIHFGRHVTVETVLSSPLIADPFHLLDCSMTSEGGAGIVLTTAERARDLDTRAAFIFGGAAEGCAPGYTYPPTYELVGGVGRGGAARAFGMAGIKPTDVDVCELYDPFSFELIRQFEAFGFCAEGEGGPFVESGVMAPGGQFPTCTDGGTMSHSHTGVSQMLQKVVQAVRQVRGDAPNQVKGAEIAMCSSAGSGSMFNPVLLVGSSPAS
ncbi:MAG: thiolase family protein [Acidimicrobiales bacterium]